MAVQWEAVLNEMNSFASNGFISRQTFELIFMNSTNFDIVQTEIIILNPPFEISFANCSLASSSFLSFNLP